MTRSRRSFASDNVAPAAAEVMDAIARINHGTVHSYGDDAETRRLSTLAQEIFECELVIHPVATGTALDRTVNDVAGGPIDGNVKAFSFRQTVQASLLAEQRGRS
mgnify:CR=1 FL=1